MGSFWAPVPVRSCKQLGDLPKSRLPSVLNSADTGGVIIAKMWLLLAAEAPEDVRMKCKHSHPLYTQSSQRPAFI